MSPATVNPPPPPALHRVTQLGGVFQAFFRCKKVFSKESPRKTGSDLFRSPKNKREPSSSLPLLKCVNKLNKGCVSATIVAT